MKILKYLFKGMLFGCTTYAITMLIGFLAVGNSIIFADATQNAISIICYIITCIGFFVPSVIYENEKLVLPVRIIIHMGIGYIVFILSAYAAGWIPHGSFTPLWWILAISSGVIIWFGFYIYNIKQAKIINKNLPKKGLNKKK